MPEGGCVLFAVASFVSFFVFVSVDLPFNDLNLQPDSPCGQLPTRSHKAHSGFVSRQFPFRVNSMTQKSARGAFPGFPRAFNSSHPDVSSGLFMGLS
jgi:hypothetical protein